jgi:tetratricopeptide (TPR) repeat protein
MRRASASLAAAVAFAFQAHAAGFGAPAELQQGCEDRDPAKAAAACGALLDLGDIPAYARREALYNRAVALMAQGDRARARADAQALLRLARDDDARAQAQALLGRVLAEADQDEPAIAALSEALKLQPDDADSRALRGEILDKLGRDDEALADLAAVAAQLRDRANPYLDLGRFYFRRANFRLAERHFDHAVANEPRSALLYYWRGMARLRLGDADAAASDFDAAIHLHRRFPAALRRRADLYAAVGDEDRAADFFSLAAAGPDADADVAAARAWIAAHQPARAPRGPPASAGEFGWLVAPDLERQTSQGR